MFRLEICAVRQDTFNRHQEYVQVSFYKKSSFFPLVGPSDTGKLQLIHNWPKIGTFQPKLDKNYFFYQHSQTLYNVIQRKLKISSLRTE